MITVIILIIIIVCALISFESAVKVLWMNGRTAANIVYSLFAFDCALAYFTFALFIYSPNAEFAFFWHSAMTVPILILHILLFHFSMIATIRHKIVFNPFIYFLIYGFALFIIIMAYCGYVIKDIYLSPVGWDHRWNTDSIWSLICGISELAGFSGSIILFTWRGLITKNSRERRQYYLIAFSIFAGFAGCALSFYVSMAEKEYHTVISYISIITLIMPFIAKVRYSIHRYKLMTLSQEQLASGLMDGIKSPVMLADTEGNLIFQNAESLKMIKDAGLKKIRNIAEFFPAVNTLKKEIKSLSGGAKWNNFINCTVLMPNGICSAFTLNLMGITNEEGDFTGVLITAFERPSIREFQAKYTITDRQVEIIFLSVSGLSNREISKRLGISERTVEHHHFNIYNKLGISNKIELHTIAHQYNIAGN